MFKRLVISILIVGLISPISATAAPVKAGQICTKPNQQTKVSGKTLVCKKSGSKFVWKTKSKSSSTGTTTPAPAVNQLPLYTGGSGGSGEKSFELPIPVIPAPASANLKLWVYHPANKNRPVNTPGIWLRKQGGDWTWQPGGNPDGSVYVTVAAGSYVFDTVEPDGNSRDFGRRTYSLTVDNSGKPSIKALQPNSAGYFTVTLVDRTTPANNAFTPTSRCQLQDQNINPGMNVGFPKSPDRLSSTGVIKALILPVDFANLPGAGKPAEIFYQMATYMDNYYKLMSNNKVSFSFQTLPTWHRVNFDPAIYKLGAWNGGDPNGYYDAVLASADSVVDYSQFDVVYVFSPKQVPSSLIAYGPAFPMIKLTDDGSVRNGTISGADAYRSGINTEWRWMAHETGHLFGIYDLYTISPEPNVYGDWDLMSNNWGDLLELNSWNRYIQGWLTDTQVKCLESSQLTTPVEVTINPLSDRNSEVKAAVVRLSDTKVLVAEVRRNGGYDKMNDIYSGVLVYTVDMTIESIKGGYQVQRRPGSIDPRFLDATLRPKDKIKVGNLWIEVISSGANGDVIRISN